MNQLTEETLDRLNDEQSHDLSSTIDKLLEDRRKRARCASDAMGETNKALEQQESAAASHFILTFGKHKSAHLRDVDLSYLTWAIEYKRSGMTLTPNPDYGVSENHLLASTRIKAYLAWRCWACRSTAVRFRNAKLCTSCWLSSKDTN